MTETNSTKKVFKVPAPICAVGLGLACLASATLAFSSLWALPGLAIWSYILAGLGAVALILYILKIILNFSGFKEDLKHPVFTTIIPAFAMAVLLLSAFLGKMHFGSGLTLWIIGIVLHFILTGNFLYQVLKGFKFENVIPSYYIAPVGIICAVMAGAGYGVSVGPAYAVLNSVLFWYGTVWYFVLFAVLVYRISQRTIPPPKMPTVAIMAAPPNLMLAAYITLGNVDPVFAVFLLGFSVVSTVYVYVMLAWKFLPKKFNPGFAAFTFPTVISAVAMLKFGAYLGALGNSLSQFFKILAAIEFFIASLVVLYVVFCYVYFLLIKRKK